MARLIDADELADYITENEDDFLYALEHKDRGLLEIMIAFIPTAYDVEKVVEELKELYDIYNQQDYDIGHHIRNALQKAIEIVKEGIEK